MAMNSARQLGSSAANLVMNHPNTKESPAALWLRKRLTPQPTRTASSGAINSPRAQLGH